MFGPPLIDKGRCATALDSGSARRAVETATYLRALAHAGVRNRTNRRLETHYSN